MSSIQKNLLNRLNKEKARSVVDIDSARLGRQIAHEYEDEVQSIQSLVEKGHDPLHAAYTYTQNFMSVLIEQASELPELQSWADLYVSLEEQYMPSGPPMSPLTQSYFWCWSAFDLTFGPDKETVGQCALTLAKELDVSDDVLKAMEAMQDSRMGFYVHDGFEGEYIRLRELMTGSLYVCHCSSGYPGSQGQIWYVRLLPPLVDELGYHVTFTTPYVVRNINESGLRDVIDQMLPLMTKRGYQTEYEELMKWGPAQKYWNEYLVMGYSNFSSDVVYLTGYPSTDPEATYHSVEDMNSYLQLSGGISDGQSTLSSGLSKPSTKKVVQFSDKKKKNKQAKQARKKNRK